ncbi:F-box only protein 46-like isoform X1 [Syngnathoides biaculeatus]|uniref:F-box only protein 46-like isoform X1 n=1 Tax=Syngnathoides biaculeatus TaxID=300417 RepID=UPI002ADD90D5|nr:F-box only protein 46-like isoform X1 [Syngnathoides biaculeatus]
MHVKASRSEVRGDAPECAGGRRRPLGAVAPNAEDGGALPDVWAIIRPGHVREKIAIFALDSRQTGSSRGGPLCLNHAPSSRPRKVKGSGDAKRQRRSAGKQSLRRNTGALLLYASARTPAGDEAERRKTSVGAMVAFLEECRASPDHAKLALARTPSPEELESVRVSDVVAKLECLRRLSEGDDPRSWPGRVLRPPSARDGGPTPRSPPSGGGAPLEEAEPLPGLLFPSAPSSPPPGVPSDEPCKASFPSPDLAPPPLAALPQDVLVCVFGLLPTRALAALKCTCRYFKSIIEDYGVRPSDSLWVSEPRYRDDPCKRCKRRYARGDVSLCRWHRKPYCQALPYGPGFWMCCQRSRRDAPGCDVGLHDNRWVPTFDRVAVPVRCKNAED